MSLFQLCLKSCDDLIHSVLIQIEINLNGSCEDPYIFKYLIHLNLSFAAASTPIDRSNTEGFDTLETVPEAVPVVLTEPPIEEQLAWHTLWPESHKLYGHGNELFSLCCDHDGKLVASSCKV